jgi:hypothetical protein
MGEVVRAQTSTHTETTAMPAAARAAPARPAPRAYDGVLDALGLRSPPAPKPPLSVFDPVASTAPAPRPSVFENRPSPRPAPRPFEGPPAVRGPATFREAATVTPHPRGPTGHVPAIADARTGFLAAVVRKIDWPALAVPDISPELLRPEIEAIEARLTRVDDLIERLTRLPLVPGPEALAEKLADLGRGDIRACLREITRTCQDLGAPPVTWETDTTGWIDLLETTIGALERRGAPRISVLPAPDGSIEGRAPRRPVERLAVRDSRAIIYGVGNTLHVVHDCAVETPVIEVASLLDHDPATDTEAWFHSVEPAHAAATGDLHTSITRSAGVSVGTGNHQQSVFLHRIGSCPVNLGILVAAPRVRRAILACREAGGTAEAMASLRRAVRQAIAATDVSALVPDSLVARLATAQQHAPSLRGPGPKLTIRHGSGISIGWNSTVTTETTVHVKKPKLAK